MHSFHIFFFLILSFSLGLFAQKLEIIPQVGHSAPIMDFEIDHQGKWGATCSEDRSVKVIELESGRLMKTLKGHQAFVNYLSFSHDDQYLISIETNERISDYGSVDMKFANVFIWRTSDWTLAHRLDFGKLEYMEFALHTQASIMTIFTLQKDEDEGKLLQIELSSGKTVWETRVPRRVEEMRYSVDGKLIALATEGSGPDEITLVEAQTGEVKLNFALEISDVQTLWFDSGQQNIFAASLYKWEQHSLSDGSLMDLSDYGTRLDFSSNRRNETGCKWLPDGTKIWMDRGVGDITSEFFIGHPMSTKVEMTEFLLPLDFERGEKLNVSLAMDRGNNRLYVLDRGQTMRLHGINLENDQVFMCNTLAQQGNSMVSFSPEGNFMLVSGMNSAGLLDMNGLRFSGYKHELETVNTIVWHPEEPTIFLQDALSNLGTQFGYLNIVSRKWEYLTKLERTVSKDAINLSPHWKYVAGEGRIFSMGGLDEIGQISTIGEPGPAAFSPEDDYVYSVSFKKSTGDDHQSEAFIKFFSLTEKASKGVMKFSIKGYGLAENTPFVISPDGKYAAIGAEEMVVVDLESRTVKHRFLAGERYGIAQFFTAMTYKPNTNLLFAGTSGNELMVFDVATGKQLRTLPGHAGRILSVSAHPQKDLIISVGTDNQILWWNSKTFELIAYMIVPSSNQYLMITPDGYFASNSKATGLVALRKGNQLQSMGNLGLKYNRPDIVWARLGLATPTQIEMMKLAREKRLRQLGLRENDLVPSDKLPTVEWIQYQNTGNAIEVEIVAKDANFNLKQLRAFVNGVPISGVDGKALTGKESRLKFQVPLQYTKTNQNRIEISVINEKGVASNPKRITLKPEGMGSQIAPKYFIVAIGVSRFKQKEFNLTYAAKDANDLSGIPYWGSNHKSIVLTDKEATVENILAVNQTLKEETEPSDIVLVFISTHGMLDEKLDYYLATYDTDFYHPKETALKYEALEGILREIPAQNRLLFIDACHAGEVDKDLGAQEANETLEGTIEFKGFKSAGMMPRSGVKNSFELMRNLFGTQSQHYGINVIAASGGMEYALESPQWNNGVFSYALMQAFTNSDNRLESEFTVTALQEFLSQKVRTLTRGLQNPAERAINPDNDFLLEKVGRTD